MNRATIAAIRRVEETHYRLEANRRAKANAANSEPVTVIRDGQQVELTVTIGDPPLHTDDTGLTAVTLVRSGRGLQFKGHARHHAGAQWVTTNQKSPDTSLAVTRARHKLANQGNSRR